MNARSRCAVSIVLYLSVAGASLADIPQVAPINTSPGGQTYGHWAAEWWQWALGIPAANNPLLDQTGEFCAERQLGDVWYLAGSFGPDPVERTCAVPAETSLFFPIINSLYGAFLNDPPETRTEEFIRGITACPVPVTFTSVIVDGFVVPRTRQFFSSAADSPLFNLQLAPGNVFGFDETTVPELVFSPSAQEGYYLFLKPLSPGMHTILIHAEGCFPGFSQDIAYNIHVATD